MAYGHPSVKIEKSPDGVSWTNITADSLADEGLTLTYGIRGSSPLDNVAGTGLASFPLRNWSPVGAYSPSHANVVADWGIGTHVRISFISQDTLTTKVKFYGKVSRIDPLPGSYGKKRCYVALEDFMGDFAEADLREIAAQVSKTEVQLLDAIHAALPTSAVPPATDFDTAVDTFPYAFYDVGKGAKAMGLLRDVMTSTFGIYFQRGDGTHVYLNRESRTFTASVDTFTESDFDGLQNSVDRQQLFNRVIVDLPQIEIGGSNEVLAAEIGTDSTGIDVGATIERFLNYRDPLDTVSGSRGIAGTSMVTPVSGTDYVFNSASDGSGTNVTASMTVNAYFFSGSMKYVITNGSAAKAYRITLQARGIAIRSRMPKSIESESTQDYGVRPLPVRLKFQTNPTIAEFMADYLRSQYEVQVNRPTMVKILPHQSERLMAHMLEREPGDRITMTESQTGLSADAIINSVNITVRQGPWFTCTWGLAPQSDLMFIVPWLIGTATRSEIGETTVLG